jgi:hypothetical protein
LRSGCGINEATLSNAPFEKPVVRRTLQIVVGALGLLCFVLPVGLGRQVSPMADDFVNHLSVVRLGGPIAYTLNVYQGWTGRLLSTLFLGMATVDLDVAGWVGALLGVTFGLIGIGSLWNFVEVEQLEGVRRLGGTPHYVWQLAIVLAGLWMGARELLSESVFWITGGIVYALPMAIGLVWLALAYRLAHAPPQRISYLKMAMWTAASAGVGTAHELLSCALGFAIVALIASSWCTLRERPRGALFGLTAGLVGLLAGTLTLLAAPGNFARAQTAQRVLYPGVEKLLVGATQVAALGLLPFCQSMLMGLASGAILYASASQVDSKTTARPYVAWGSVLVVAGAASLLPLLPVANVAPARAFFFLSVLTYAGALQLGYAGSLRLGHWRSTEIGIPHPFRGLRLAGLVLLCFYIVQISFDIQAAHLLKLQLTGRTEALRALRGTQTIVTVAPLQGQRPSTVYYDDITADPDYSTNQAVAGSFDLAGVRLLGS